MEPLISANSKQIMLLFVIVQLVLLFPFFVHRKKFSFQWKNSTAATAERTTFSHVFILDEETCARESHVMLDWYMPQ